MPLFSFVIGVAGVLGHSCGLGEPVLIQPFASILGRGGEGPEDGFGPKWSASGLSIR